MPRKSHHLSVRCWCAGIIPQRDAKTAHRLEMSLRGRTTKEHERSVHVNLRHAGFHYNLFLGESVERLRITLHGGRLEQLDSRRLVHAQAKVPSHHGLAELGLRPRVAERRTLAQALDKFSLRARQTLTADRA